MDMLPEQLILRLTEQHIYRFTVFIGLSVIWGVIRWMLKSPSGKWFALMTAAWVLVNIVVAFWLKNHLVLPEPDAVVYTVRHVVFWVVINQLLDLGYILCAFLLIRRSRRLVKDTEILVGFGQAIYLQGLGLLLLDTLFLSFVLVAF